MSQTEKIFTEGIYLNKVHEKAPAFIIANVSIDVKKAIDWLQTLEHKGLVDEKGYVRIVGKESQQGKRYFEVDTWKPTSTTETPENRPQPSTGDATGVPYPTPKSEGINTEDIPFNNEQPSR